MDVFALREQLVDDYRAFTGSFVTPRDGRIGELLARRQPEGAQWPEPWLPLNPAFATGGSVDELVAEGLLDPGCARVFRVKAHPDDPGADPIVFHRHQRDAIEVAATGRSYVLTTGTGSGKSLAYVAPIVDRILRGRSAGAAGAGVKAIVVYPMNALANSQVEELRKFLDYGFAPDERPVTFARYTGQEGPDERRRILAEPPDILLTNYVMLDLVLTRPDERRHLVTAARGLRFLVLDELHTYRGRQGADVAMLVRRVRDACELPDLQVVGTSATVASGGTRAEQRKVVADVAGRLFGTNVLPGSVIGETPVPATGEPPTGQAATLRDRVAAWADASVGTQGWADLAADLLAGWVETHFGLAVENGTGELVRRAPARLGDVAGELAEATGLDSGTCREALQRLLLLNFFYIEQLPTPAPTSFDEGCPWNSGRTLADWIEDRVDEMVHTSDDMAPAAASFGDDGLPFEWDVARRATIRAELDAAFFHIYGVDDRDDVAYILSTFPIANRKDPGLADRMLDAYDALAEVAAMDVAYVSPLDPLPGDGARHD